MKFIDRLLNYVQYHVRQSLRLLRLKLTPSSKLSSIEQFRRDGWDKKIYRSVPPLPQGSIVVFGGYKGDSTAAWLKKFPTSHVNVFEPVGEFAQVIKARFNSKSVTVHEFGISKAREQKKFVLTNDSTFASEINPKLTLSNLESQVDVQFLPVSTLDNLLPSVIDVLEINIEGGEYELIGLLCASKFIERVTLVFVQFHPVQGPTARLLESTRNELSKTHKQVWSYEMVWEMWEKIKK